MIISLVDEAVRAGARASRACAELGLSARTLERWRAQDISQDLRAGPKAPAAHKLTEQEEQAILDTANSPEFRDKSPRQIVPLLADQGVYIASEASFYRTLHKHDQMAHRERSRPPTSRKPDEKVARGPNEVWCWDITYLRSSVRGVYFYLYLIIDIYSRKIVGFRVEELESMELAAELVERATREQNAPRKLVLHADNGGPMKGSSMLATLHKLGVLASFSRPRVSDDNPYAEALFRTLKYRPGYPTKPFANLAQAAAWVAGFVAWYNDEHLHSAIRFVTPNQRHARTDVAILAKRHSVYAAAYERTPARWTRNTRNWTPIGPVVLNPNGRTSSLN